MKDLSGIPPELLAKLKEWESKKPENQQLQVLADIAVIAQELVNVADDTQKATEDVSKQLSSLGAVLDDSRQHLMDIKKKEAPESPDYAKPVVAVLDRVLAEIKKQELKPVFKPDIKVSTPEVRVPDIDLTGIEKLLKTEVPKAFKEAIKLIPKTEIPEQDDSELQDLVKQLIGVTEEVRDKRVPLPAFPKQMVVTNEDGSPIGGSSSSYSKPTDEYDLIQDDDTSSASYEYYGFMKADGGWYIKRVTLATNLREYVKGTSGYTTAWTGRAGQSYADYGATF